MQGLSPYNLIDVAGRQFVFNHQNANIQKYLFSLFVFIFLALFSISLSSQEINFIFQAQNLSQIPPLIERGENLLRKGQYQQAIEEFTKYLKSALAEDLNTLICYWNLGILFWNIDQLDESVKNFGQANKLALALNLQKKRHECETALKIHNLFTQAIEWRNKGNLSRSNQYFKEATNFAKSLKSNAHELKILRTWSANYAGDTLHIDFLDLNKQALQLARSLKHAPETTKALKNIGSFYWSKNIYSQALSYFFQALSSARGLQDDKEITLCLSNIASLYSTLGDNEKSIVYYSEALKILKSLDSQSKLSALLINLSLSYQTLYRTTGIADHCYRAIELYKESSELAQKLGDKNLKNLSMVHIGNVYVDLKQYDGALKFLQPALEMAQKRKDSLFLPSILASIGMVYLNKQNYTKAEDYLNRALAEARKAQSDPLMMRAFYGLGLCKEKSGDYRQTISNYNECLRIIDKIGSKIVDDIDRASYTQDKAQIYHRMINLYYDLFLKTKSTAFEKEIFSIAEKAKARSFVEYLERLRKRDSAPASGQPNPQEEKLKISRLDILKKLSSGGSDKENLSRLETQLRLIDDQISSIHSSQFLQTETSEILARPLALEYIQNKLLKNDTALIEYILGNERSYLISISNASYRVTVLPSQDKIVDMMTGYLGYLEDPEIEPIIGIAAARRLYRELFYPVEGFIPKSVTNLIIISDGLLFHLPFETLVSNHGTDSKPDYLANRYLISYAPSASAFFYLLKRPKPESYSKDLLAFGAPSYAKPASPGNKDSRSPSQILLDLYEKSGFSLSPIPYSAKEVKEISKHFQPDKKDVYLKKEANEQTLKSLDLNNYRIVHFACHAFSDESYPLRSTLVFSLDGSDEEDGFFQVLEMYKLRLNAELTVLSACQTGKGKNIQNEGVLGLPRVFFYMGSRSVISTLWSIDDEATSRFMGYFYEYYAHNIGKAQSLQLAKQRMMGTKYSHPFYWGAFILTGEY
jgi:CHAT domain-containing protein/tetratricopeptide (TPR) repeat protein